MYAGGVADVESGMAADVDGAITTIATAPHAAGLKRAAGCETATTAIGAIGSPTQTCGEIGTTATCETEKRFDPKLTAAHFLTNILQLRKMYLLRPSRHPLLPLVRFRPAPPTHLTIPL